MVDKLHDALATIESVSKNPSRRGQHLDIRIVGPGCSISIFELDELRSLISAPAQSVGVQEAAQAMVDLFVWEPDDESGEVTPHLDRQTPHLYDVLTKLRDALAAQPPAAPVETPRRMYDSQNGEHYVVDAKGDAYEPDRSSAAAPAETDIQAALGDDYKLYSRRKLEEENARPRAQLRSSAGNAGEIDTRKLIASILSEFFPGKQWYRDLAALAIFERVISAQPQAAVTEALLDALQGLMVAYGATDGRNGNSGECWDKARKAVVLASSLSRPQSRTGEA